MMTLDPQLLARYSRDGFLVVSDVFNDQGVQELLEESARLWLAVKIDQKNRRIQWRKRVDGSRTADRIDPVLDISPLIEKAANGPCITSVAGQLLNCPKPEVFKCKLISKWPQTTGYAMHQDYTYWPGLGDASPDHFVTALVALDPFEPDCGALELFPGLHHVKLPPAIENPKDVDESSVDLSTGVSPVLSPGDVVFFHGMAPHRSGPNLSPHNRQSLFFTYVTPGNAELGKQYYALRPDDFMEPG